MPLQLFHVKQRVQLTTRAPGWDTSKLAPTGRVLEYDPKHVNEDNLIRPYRVQLDNGSTEWYAEYHLSESTHGLRTSNG